MTEDLADEKRYTANCSNLGRAEAANTVNCSFLGLVKAVAIASWRLQTL